LLQGTSKPTKYILLEDELQLSPDEIQKLCFYSCFNCTRTRSVIAIPIPVRYADLCAYRSKAHLAAQLGQEEGRSRGSGGTINPSDEEAIIGKLNEQAKLNENIKHRLYYC